MNFICDRDKQWSFMHLEYHGSPVPTPRSLLPHLIPGICAQTNLAPRECGTFQASQEGWVVSSCLLLLSLENFIPVSTTPRAPTGLWGMALAHGLLPHAWAWMCSFHLGFTRRVQSRRLAEWWQYVPEVTLGGLQVPGSPRLERGEAIPNCMMAMTVNGQSPCWPGTASGQLLLTVALQRPRWGTHTYHQSCAMTGQYMCHCHQELWLLVML